MNTKKMTDDELRTRLAFWLKCQRESREMVKELVTELLRRKQCEVQDGFWSAWGFIPND